MQSLIFPNIEHQQQDFCIYSLRVHRCAFAIKNKDKKSKKHFRAVETPE